MNDPFQILPRLDGVFHFIPRDHRIDWERLGWWVFASLDGTHHGEHAVLGHFPCADRCKMAVPL